MWIRRKHYDELVTRKDGAISYGDLLAKDKAALVERFRKLRIAINNLFDATPASNRVRRKALLDAIKELPAI